MVLTLPSKSIFHLSFTCWWMQTQGIGSKRLFIPLCMCSSNGKPDAKRKQMKTASHLNRSGCQKITYLTITLLPLIVNQTDLSNLVSIYKELVQKSLCVERSALIPVHEDWPHPHVKERENHHLTWGKLHVLQDSEHSLLPSELKGLRSNHLSAI